MLARQGTRLCIVGLAGSPIYGVVTTSSGYTGGLPTGAGSASAQVSGRDVFMELMLAELDWGRIEILNN